MRMADKKNPKDKKSIDRDLAKFYDHIDQQKFESEDDLKAFL